MKRVDPLYPDEAKPKRIQGQIVVRILIDRNGDVEQACGTGDPMLRKAAEDAAFGWKFRTPRLKSEALPYLQEALTFNFVLSN